MKKENKTMKSGVTLVSLAITIIVIVILAGIVTSAGTDSIINSKKTAFITEIEMIQEKVDTIYEKRKLNEENISYYDTLGNDLSLVEQSKLNLLLDGKEEAGYRYFSKEDLKQLDLDNMNQNVIINFETRDVASINGFEIENTVCYRLTDIPGYRVNNIEYENKNTEAPTFDLEVTELSDSWLITAKNIVYNSNVATGTLSYKMHGNSEWIIVGKNSFFEVPEHGLYDVKLTDSAGNETINQIGTNCTLVADANGNKIPVPLGFSPITTADQGTKDTGFVIKNDEDENEFVWVPCTIEGTEGSIRYDRYAFTREGWIYNQTLNSTTGEIKEGTFTYMWTERIPGVEEKSIRTYEGFYIGRYESGVTENDLSVSTSNSSNLEEWTGYTKGKLVIKSGQQVWNYITRNKAKIISEDLYKQSKRDSVNSRLCSSYAWDTTLKFIQMQKNTYPTNSIGGNYSRTISYTGYDTVHPCNIYDMGGNLWEWTTEVYGYESYPCTFRGGYCNDNASDYPAATRSYGSTTSANIDVSFRITLYL